MNPASNPNSGNGVSPHAGLNLDDIVFVLFRHKWLILGSVLLGLMGVVAVAIVKPPLAISNAKLMVKFVTDSQGVAPDKQGDLMRPTDSGGVLGSEMEILTSLDVALQAVDDVGAGRLLAHYGGGSDRMAAAGLVCKGLEVEVPRATSVLSVSFKHPEKDVVQPVLKAVIQTYMRKHQEVHQPPTEYYDRQVEEWRSKLNVHEEELKKLKSQAHVLFIDDTKRSYQTQISKTQDELLEAKKDLAERKAILGDLGNEDGGTNDMALTVPPDKVSDYSFAASELESLKRRERELLLQYKPAHPTVLTVRSQIDSLKKQKADLESEFSALALLGTSGVGRGGTNEHSTKLSGDASDMRLLGARVSVLGTLLTNLQAEAERVLQLEPQIAQAQRQRDEAQKQYEFFLGKKDSVQRSGDDPNNTVNMSVVQNPTPPGLDLKKFKKLAGLVLAGCIGLGLGLAFALELFLDRSIKRSVDVERHLRIPVMLTIPDAKWKRRRQLPWWLGGGRQRTAPVSKNGETAIVRWDPADQIQIFTAGLRERLVTYFEIRNLNLKKPKLVAVTGCSEGSGVTTLAGGLAAELSRTGDGNVLLVDMNSEQGVARSFHQGKPGCGIAEVLESDFESDGQGDAAKAGGYPAEGSDKLAKVIPAHFLHMEPKLNMGEYDYIVFDMPPVSPTSPTPRLAAHMDLVLLVLESEKTGQAAAKRAGLLMSESKANVAAILNKFRPHVPAKLSSDA